MAVEDEIKNSRIRMIRKMLSDYILTGKNTHLKDNRRNGIPVALGDVYLFPLCLQIMVILKGIMGSETDILRDTILLLGFFFIWVSQIKHPMKLDRMYYLCPMDERERSSYLRNAFIFRGCLHTILVVIICLILYFAYRINIFAVLYILIDGIMYSFLSNVREGKWDLIRAVFLKPALFISAYLQFALPAEELGRGDYVFIACSFAFLLLIELPMFIAIIRRVNNDIKNIATCEEDYYVC